MKRTAKTPSKKRTSKQKPKVVVMAIREYHIDGVLVKVYPDQDKPTLVVPSWYSATELRAWKKRNAGAVKAQTGKTLSQ